MGFLDAMTADTLGYLAAGLVFLTFLMTTMSALRAVAIASNLAFILYAAVAGLTPILVLHGLLLPLNVFRLVQLRRHVLAAVEAESRLALTESFDWLIPMGKRLRLKDGAMLFRKGEPGRSMFVIVDGSMVLPDIGVTLGRGALLGEISLFSESGLRTASACASGPVELAELSEARVQELSFDNPKFAHSLLRVIAGRLVENLHRMEAAGRRSAPDPSGEPVPAVGP